MSTGKLLVWKREFNGYLDICACNKKTPELVASSPTPDETPTAPGATLTPPQISPQLTLTPASEELLALLPSEEGFVWIYNGFAEYGHQMMLNSIMTDSETSDVIYDITGLVDDASGGESNKNYSMSIKYYINDQTIIQEQTGDMLMDSDFEHIEIIKLPLEKDNTWEQTTLDDMGNSITLLCTIEEVSVQDGKKVYSVVYQDSNSDYYEKRKIKEDIGVTSFEKLYISETDEPFVIGYFLFSGE